MLLIHGERDEIFPLADAESVAACLRTNGVPVELRVLPGVGHGFDGNLMLLCRVVGEQCLLRLEGAGCGAELSLRSLLAGQGQAAVGVPGPRADLCGGFREFSCDVRVPACEAGGIPAAPCI